MQEKIAKINFTEGTNVKQGDVLFEFDTESTSSILQSYLDDQKKLQDEITYLEKLKMCFEQSRNLFDRSKSEEQQYYYIFENYLLEVNNTIKQTDDQKNSVDAQISEYKNAISKYNSTNSTLKTENKQAQYVIDAIRNNTLDKVTIKNSGKYFSSFQKYLADMNTIRSKVFNTVELEAKLQEYTKNFIYQLQSEIDTATKTINNNNSTINRTSNVIKSLSNQGSSNKTIREQSKLKKIIGCNQDISTKQSNLSALNKEIVKFRTNIENAKVVAPSDGCVNIFTPISIGETVQAGLQVCSVVPNNKNNYKLVLYVDPKDINEVKIGQEVKIRLSSLPYSDYGELTGIIISVSTDSRANEYGGFYYIAECSIKHQQVVSKKGQVKTITVGMTGEMHVITDEKTILSWVLEKINFLD